MTRETPLVDALASYLNQSLTIRSPHTESLHRVSNNHFTRYLGRTPLVADFTDANLIGYCRARRAAGIADSTLDRECAKLLTLWRWIANKGLIPMPNVKLPRYQRKPPRAFTRAELKQLFRAAYASTRVFGGIPGSIFWPAMIGVLWDSGERVAALFAVERHDIDLPRRLVTFRVRKGNGDVQRRVVSRRTAKDLAKLLEATDRHRPFMPSTRSAAYKAFARLLEDAGLPNERTTKFHCLRRSHASYLFEAGGDVSASLGHSSTEMLRYYLDRTVISGKHAVDLLFDPVDGSEPGRATWRRWLRRGA